MKPKAIFFGSIGTLVETSDLQRRAFNQAFLEAKLDWYWDVELYKSLLKKAGGKSRIQDFAVQKGIPVNAPHLHKRKTEIFNDFMTKKNLPLRPGVSEVISYAIKAKISLAFVTTTSKANIEAIFFALGDQIHRNNFDFIGDETMVANPKPNPDIYIKALTKLGIKPTECIAIEDTETSMEAALTANIDCVAFPGQISKGNSFDGAKTVTEKLSPSYFVF
jgi:HAD superfamily hydrolase (TIGR01509 family)